MFQEGHGSSGAPNGSQEKPAEHSVAPPNRTLGSDLLTRFEIFAARIPKSYITPFCGASAGVASGIVTCPLDVIKTKLQAQGGFARRSGQVGAKTLYRGMFGSGRIIWREDGIRGLYQGLGPMLLGYLPTWAVYLAVYDRSREYFYGTTGQYFRSSFNRGLLNMRQQIAGGCREVMHRLRRAPAPR